MSQLSSDGKVSEDEQIAPLSVVDNDDDDGGLSDGTWKQLRPRCNHRVNGQLRTSTRYDLIGREGTGGGRERQDGTGKDCSEG